MEYKPSEETVLYDEYCDTVIEAYFGLESAHVTPEMNQQIANVMNEVAQDGMPVFDRVEGSWPHAAYHASVMAAALYKEGDSTGLGDFLSEEEINDFIHAVGFDISDDQLQQVESALNDTYKDPRMALALQDLFENSGIGYAPKVSTDVTEMALLFGVAFRINGYPTKEETQEAISYIMEVGGISPDGYSEYYYEEQDIELFDELVENMKGDQLTRKETMVLHEMLRSDFLSEQVLEYEWMRHRGHYFGLASEIRQMIQKSKTPHEAAEIIHMGAMIDGEIESAYDEEFTQEDIQRIQEATQDAARDMVLIVKKAGTELSEERQWEVAYALCKRIFDPELYIEDWFKQRYGIEIPINI